MAAASAKPTVVALLALPEVTAATLYGFYDALSSAGRDWPVLHGREPGAPPFRPLIVSHDGQPLIGANGVRIQADTSFAECPPPDVVCITDLAVMPGQPLGDVYDPAVAWLQAMPCRAARCSPPPARARCCWRAPGCCTTSTPPRTGPTARR